MQPIDTGEQQKIMKLKAESNAKDKEYFFNMLYNKQI
jgi:hypothetical protein